MFKSFRCIQSRLSVSRCESGLRSLMQTDPRRNRALDGNKMKKHFHRIKKHFHRSFLYTRQGYACFQATKRKQANARRERKRRAFSWTHAHDISSCHGEALRDISKSHVSIPAGPMLPRVAVLSVVHPRDRCYLQLAFCLGAGSDKRAGRTRSSGRSVPRTRPSHPLLTYNGLGFPEELVST